MPAALLPPLESAFHWDSQSPCRLSGRPGWWPGLLLRRASSERRPSSLNGCWVDLPLAAMTENVQDQVMGVVDNAPEDFPYNTLKSHLLETHTICLTMRSWMSSTSLSLSVARSLPRCWPTCWLTVLLAWNRPSCSPVHVPTAAACNSVNLAWGTEAR